MKNFLKYLILMVADLLAVGIVAGTVIRTIVYGIVGEENHHIYMIIRVTLIILIFFTGSLIINYKNDDKRISFRDSKEISSVVNGNLTYGEMILHNKLFKSEVISFVVFNLVGVDIGCGVDLVQTDIDFAHRLDELDAVIRKYIPFGMDTHPTEMAWDFEQLRCWKYLDKETKTRAMTALGTLGGGNHFIEAYEGGWLSVHSGSRNIGYKVAAYYQTLAEKRVKEHNYSVLKEQIKSIEPTQREKWIADHKIQVNRDLCYLTGADMDDYLHDVAVMQKFANDNRMAMLKAITYAMGGTVLQHINSIHNYIDTENMYLRKGAISAQEGQILVIPLNMRDGLLVCEGKGNPEWNYSAPHGAGRLYSRSKAKEIFTVEEYAQEMDGIYSSCINESTLDEAPFVYKDYVEIMECIEPTVKILDRLIPIFNFKANG